MLKTYQDMPVSLNEELGEVICNECGGYGAIPRTVKIDEIQSVCQKCQGTGKLDWCQQVVGVAPPKQSTFGFSLKNCFEYFYDDNQNISYQQNIINKISKELAYKIDSEIIELTKGVLEQNDDETNL